MFAEKSIVSAKPASCSWSYDFRHTTLCRAMMLFVVASVLNLSSAHAQKTYWMGRIDGTQYVFDKQLPQSFGDAIAGADGNTFLVEKNPRPFHYLDIAGMRYSLLKTSIASNWEMFDNRLPTRTIAIVAQSGVFGADGSWVKMQTTDAHVEQLAQSLPKREKDGPWFRTELMIMVSPDATKPRLQLPVPKTTLARNAMVKFGGQTLAGFYYPQVQRPLHIVPFRQGMLDYGNAGRQDPDFRKNNGSKTATDLSGDTTYVGENSKWETVTKDSPTAPYFADHVANRELTEAAQFQAEYQASIDKMTHDGPASYKGDARLGDFNTRVGYFKGPGKSFEACGGGSPGSCPHAWMVGETHFRPWFNVSGAIHQVGYGAAKSQSGNWYYTAVISQTPVAGPATAPTAGHSVADTNPTVPGGGTNSVTPGISTPVTTPGNTNVGTSPSGQPSMQPGGSSPGSQFTTGKKLSVASMDTAVKNMTDPSTGGYRLVYDADLGKLGAGFSYDADNSQTVGDFDSIGYLLEIGKNAGINTSVFDADPVEKVFVTMKAFTKDATKIGIPIAGLGASFQQPVESMNVFSTVAGINGMGTGSIEFWANDYLPGDSGVYDSKDKIAGRDSGYGSMQIHNPRGETVFALNAWNDGPQADIGIGNSAINHEGKIHKDWTFANNAASYTSKRLRVYVRSGQNNVGTTPAMTHQPSSGNAPAVAGPPPAAAPAAANSASGMTIEEKREFVRYHNRVRGNVGAGLVSWSEDLEVVAQQWANHLAATGTFDHRNEVGGQWKTSYGENLAINSTALKGAEAWYGEIKDYTSGAAIGQPGADYKVVGHYTQMVWSKTHKIGAAVAVMQSGSYKGQLVIVCNYDPPGNYNGQKPY